MNSKTVRKFLRALEPIDGDFIAHDPYLSLHTDPRHEMGSFVYVTCSENQDRDEDPFGCTLVARRANGTGCGRTVDESEPREAVYAAAREVAEVMGDDMPVELAKLCQHLEWV